jgi:hypothetical protein
LHSQQQPRTGGGGWGATDEPFKPVEELLEPELHEPLLKPGFCQPPESLQPAPDHVARTLRVDVTSAAAHRARIQADAVKVQDVQLEASVGSKR